VLESHSYAFARQAALTEATAHRLGNRLAD
jgi:hypothetical protein